MTKTSLSTLAAAAILSCGLLPGRAVAMPSAASAPPHLQAGLLHEAAVLCGGNGCAPVQTKQAQRKKFHPLGYTKPI
jgi:hypothetical protein